MWVLTRSVICGRTRSLNCLYPPCIELFPNMHAPHHGVAFAHVQLSDAVDVLTTMNLMHPDNPYDRKVQRRRQTFGHPVWKPRPTASRVQEHNERLPRGIGRAA